jgi:Protein of unknown function (DUF3788)
VKAQKTKSRPKTKPAPKPKKPAAPLSLNAFVGKSERPSADELASALGPAKSLWDELVGDLVREIQIDVQEWNSYSTKAGWSLRLKHGKRNIVYLGPLRGSFRVALILGDKAVKVAQQSPLPARVHKMIAEARRYAEGTGVRIDVQGPEDIAVIKQLAQIKLEN